MRVLVNEAKRRGAKAKVIQAKDIVVDDRVRLRCFVPLCSSYGQHLLCPPNLMTVDDFRRVLSCYTSAVLIQVEAKLRKDSDEAGRAVTRMRVLEKRSAESQLKLHDIIQEVEALAFRKGYYLAAGLIGGDCALCHTCAGRNQKCRYPFKARPSMEAMGIDVIKTSNRAGMPVRLSSNDRVTWTGLILVD